MKKGFHAHAHKAANANTDFRHVAYTGEYAQMVYMSLEPNEDIGAEIHGENDQYFAFTQGEGQVIINDTEYDVVAGDVVIVPAGEKHNVINTSAGDRLQLYTLYTPPHHADGTVRPTKAEAEADEPHFDGQTTE